MTLGSTIITATGTEINKLSGVTAITSEINTLAEVTAGTVAASKALVVDANKDLSSLRNLTLTGTIAANTLAGSLSTAAQTAITSVGSLSGLTTASLTLGATAITATGTEINTLAGVTATTSEINTLAGVTAGTVTVSKVLVVDANKDLSSLRNLTLTGTLSGVTTLTATTLAGTLSTVAQSNITSVGTLTSLVLSGAISGVTTIEASGIISFSNSTLSTSATTGGLVLSGGLGIAKNTVIGGTAISSASWGTSGIQYNSLATSYTNNSTASSGTAASAVFTSFAQPTLLATNTTVTTTNAATVYIANAPIASTNMTLTNAYSLWVPSGKVLFGANVASSSTTTGTLIVTGGVGVSGTLTANTLSGTLSTAVQGNITSVGILTSLTTSGYCYSSKTTATARFIANCAGSYWLGLGPDTTSNDDTIRLGLCDSVGTWSGYATVRCNNAYANSKVTIGTPPSNSPWPFYVYSTVSTNAGVGYAYFNSSNSSGTSDGSTTATYSAAFVGRILVGGEINVTSDFRTKKDIELLDIEYCKKFISKANPIKFRYKEGDDKVNLGFIAQDVYKAGFTELVSIVPKEGLEELIEDDGFVNPKDHSFVLTTGEIIPILVLNIKDLYEENEILKNKNIHIEDLETKANLLEEKNNILETKLLNLETRLEILENILLNN